jgi:hypothetical protein
VKELEDVYRLPGMLSAAEVDCLFQLARFNQYLRVTGCTIQLEKMAQARFVGKRFPLRSISGNSHR